MRSIHPTAVVAKSAQIADQVAIGPFSVIGEQVIIGTGTTIGSHTIIEGFTEIGEGNRIGHHSVLGGAPQDMKYQNESTRLIIGNNNTIREFVTIHTGTIQDQGMTVLGNRNWIMSYVHIGHDCVIGDNVIMSSNAQLAGHVRVGNWAVLGGMSGVHQFIRIGEHSMLGGASALVQDLPPFVIAAGNKAVPHGINVEGLKRRGFNLHRTSNLRSAYRILYKQGLSLEHAVEEIVKMAQQETDHDSIADLMLLADFLKNSQRGIIRS